MRKCLFLIATAAIVASCSNLDTLKEVNTSNGNENDGAIAFTSFTDKVTKATAENSEALYTWTFFEHQESFKIWARKAEQPTNEIFGGSTVTVAPATTPAVGYTYTYAPARFWDKTSEKYHFYAAAPAEPADGAWEFKGTTTEISNLSTLGNGYFKTTSTMNGVNLKSVGNGGPDGILDNIFKTATVDGTSTKDIDKLIAAPCEITNSYYNKANPDAVNLNFIHILSKLNITISTSLYNATSATDATSTYDIDLLAFEVHNIPSKGNFNEKSDDFVESGKNIRWELTGSTTTNILTGIDNSTNKVDVANPTAANTTGAKTYIVESLVIPQEIEYERVALDGKAHVADTKPAVYYSGWEDYTQSMPIEALTKEKFDELYVIDPQTFAYTGVKTLAQYQALEGKSETTEAQFKELLKKIEKTPAINIPAYDAVSESSKPYFKITYSIDGDIFTQYYNLAATFLNYNNNNQKYVAGVLTDLDLDGQNDNDDPTTFGFYEGWQNTLHIIINPTMIEFAADVATWSTVERDYEIEKGNENPNTDAPQNP